MATGRPGSLAAGGLRGAPTVGWAPRAPAPAAPLSPPTRLCRDAAVESACRNAEEVEAWLRDPDLRVLGAGGTPRGRQGARVLTLSAGGVVFRAKWRAYSTISTVNDPRLELGAHAVQKLFLQPHEYVVPPTAAYCFEIDTYRAVVDATAEPTLDVAPCVVGYLSYWLEDAWALEDADDAGVLEPDQGPLDRALFERSAAYRRSLSNLNVLTYLIRNGDTHDKQFLVAASRSGPRVYSVDNSIAFGKLMNPDLTEEENWSTLHVPVSRVLIARLRAIAPESLDALGAIDQLELRGRRLVPTTPRPGRVSDTGYRWRGDALQIGLTEEEIEGVRARLAGLIAAVERGSQATF